VEAGAERARAAKRSRIVETGRGSGFFMREVYYRDRETRKLRTRERMDGSQPFVWVGAAGY
jgi:hypothetical protein